MIEDELNSELGLFVLLIQILVVNESLDRRALCNDHNLPLAILNNTTHLVFHVSLALSRKKILHGHSSLSWQQFLSEFFASPCINLNLTLSIYCPDGSL